MGLFDFLFNPKNKSVLDDAIYRTEGGKLKAIEELVRELVVKNDCAAVILSAHFPVCLAQLQAIADKIVTEDVRGAVSVNVFMDDELQELTFPDGLVGEDQTVEVLLGERHPLWSKSQAIIEMAEKFPFQYHLRHFLSLEDPTLAPFVSEFVTRILEEGGFGDEQAIESRMVSKRIVQAQKLNDKAAGGRANVYSAESSFAWMEQCIPSFKDSWLYQKLVGDREA